MNKSEMKFRINSINYKLGDKVFYDTEDSILHPQDMVGIISHINVFLQTVTIKGTNHQLSYYSLNGKAPSGK